MDRQMARFPSEAPMMHGSWLKPWFHGASSTAHCKSSPCIFDRFFILILFLKLLKYCHANAKILSFKPLPTLASKIKRIFALKKNWKKKYLTYLFTKKINSQTELTNSTHKFNYQTQLSKSTYKLETQIQPTDQHSISTFKLITQTRLSSSLNLNLRKINSNTYPIQIEPSGTVDAITPPHIKYLRNVLNTSAMDIMYYTSPIYCGEIQEGVATEMNRLYSMFCERNPHIKPRISVIAHSLGAVIVLEPLVIKDYCKIAPLPIHPCNAAKPVPYSEMPLELEETDSFLTSTIGAVSTSTATSPPAVFGESSSTTSPDTPCKGRILSYSFGWHILIVRCSTKPYGRRKHKRRRASSKGSWTRKRKFDATYRSFSKCVSQTKRRITRIWTT
ncbi:unnamed protein product [Nesidiocoris tenuis]|uniref:DDHD domain-containing protein n=1 Tax=Nesidiocoris tenuis TaxID=355587 RepID=A0A6H5GFL4_9HEMI|nr:unnamed protein product [Nesidiocoris tenuis]